MRKAGNPQQLQPGSVVISYEDSRRVDRFAVRVGRRLAAQLLNVSDPVLAAARDQGRMQRATHARIMSNLEREEAKAS